MRGLNCGGALKSPGSGRGVLAFDHRLSRARMTGSAPLVLLTQVDVKGVILLYGGIDHVLQLNVTHGSTDMLVS